MGHSGIGHRCQARHLCRAGPSSSDRGPAAAHSSPKPKASHSSSSPQPPAASHSSPQMRHGRAPLQYGAMAKARRSLRLCDAIRSAVFADAGCLFSSPRSCARAGRGSAGGCRQSRRPGTCHEPPSAGRRRYCPAGAAVLSMA